MHLIRKRSARKTKRHKIRKTKKRRKTKKGHLRGGGINEDFLKELKRKVPLFFREQLKKECDTGDTLDNLNKLKCNFTADILEKYINRSIDEFNEYKMGWYTDDETRMPHKFSCSFIRQIYGSLIDSVIDEWIHITKDDTPKTKGLGSSYIRWVLRVTVRRFTNTSLEATKLFCDPIVLEKRDMDKYNCEQDKPCPSEEYLINRLHLSGVDENDDKWLILVDSSKRDNETYNLVATFGKHFGV